MTQLKLPLTEAEIRALDSLIKDGVATRYPLSVDERVALSIWNGATHSARSRPIISRLRDIPSMASNEIERWFKREGTL